MVSSGSSPSSAAPLHCPCGGVVRAARAIAGLATRRGPRPLLRTRGQGLSRRGVGSRRPVRPDGLGGPCRFRLPVGRREAGGQMVRDGLVCHVAELLHARRRTVAILTTRSADGASTLKIVVMSGRPSDDEAADGEATSSRELAFRLLHIRRRGAGIRRRFTSGRQVGGLGEIACGNVGICRRLRKSEQCCRLFS